MKKFNTRSAFCIGLLLLTSSDHVLAEDATVEDKPKQARNRMLEEVIVTANRREEDAQDVPQSITAFSAEKLEAMGVGTIQDLPSITPGLTITNQAGYNMAFLRGVGTDAFLPGADASVPFYVDGIPLLGTQGSSDTLGKILRVEVLKGPQGTLFGTNSIGGAINIITPDPSEDFHGDVKLGGANYDASELTVYANLPLTDDLAASVSAFHNRQDNFYTNISGPEYDIWSWGGRIKVRWDISDQLSNTLSLAYNKVSNNAGLTFENTKPAAAFGPLITRDPKADRKVDYDGYYVGALNHSWTVSDIFEWRPESVDVKAILSAQELASDEVQATFGVGRLPLLLAQQTSTSKQYTAELQVLSNESTPFSDRLTWVGGLFYIYTNGGLDPFTAVIEQELLSTLLGDGVGGAVSNVLAPVTDALLGSNLEDGITIQTYGVIRSEATSAFFQGTLALTDSLNLIVGGRYQYTEKDLLGSRTSVYSPLAPGGEVVFLSDEVPTLKARQFSPRIGLQWFIDESLQFYASYARGYKTPTYNSVNLTGSLVSPINEVKAQRNDAYEAGIKTELFDGALRLNSTIFYTKEKDLLTGIVQVLSGGVVNYDNTNAAEIKGVEIDALWTPMPDWNPGLVLSVAAAHLDTEYTDYKNGRGYDPDTGLAYGPGTFPVLPERDLSGNEIVRSPELTYNLGITQALSVGEGTLELALDGGYNSGFYWSPQNVASEETESYILVNARITYMYEPWGLDVSLWGKNLTDEVYNLIVFTDDFGRSQVLNDPTTYGLRLKWAF